MALMGSADNVGYATHLAPSSLPSARSRMSGAAGTGRLRNQRWALLRL